MKVLKRIQILRAVDNQSVDAAVVRLTADFARDRIDKVWWKLPEVPAEDMNR